MYNYFYCFIVAGPPTITSAEQVSPGTTIRVSWSAPAEGAPVTGYRVFYTSNGVTESQSVGLTDTTNLNGLINDGRSYTITVEATSEHLSGLSDVIDVVLLGELSINPPFP